VADDAVPGVAVGGGSLSCLTQPMTRANEGVNHRRFLVSFLALVAVGFLSRDIVPLPSEIARFAVAAWISALAIAWAPHRHWTQRSACGVALAAAGVIGVIASPWSALRLTSLGLWVAGVGLELRDDEQRRSLAGPMCATLVLAILDLAPTARLVLANASSWLSGALLAPFGGGSFSGPSGGLVASLVLLTCLGGTSRRAASFGQKLAVALALAVLFLGHLGVERHLVAGGVRAAWSGAAFLLGALVVAAYLALPARGSPAGESGRGGGALLAGLAAACILLPVSLATVDGLRDSAQPSKRILLVDVAMLADYRTPADKPPGQAFTGASFGLLPLYLRAYGHDCTLAAGFDVDLRTRADVVIVINPGRAFTSDEREILLDFVRKGGGFLALADHTDIGGIMESFNALLASTGLRVHFDSAVSARHEWRGSLILPYPESVIFSDADVPVSIGASVSGAPWAAVRPLLLGTDAFSDPGDRSNEEGLLGNLEFDPGEDYGDILLGVERDLGQGRVALLGDTSVFQNLALASSSGYVDRLVRHLGSGARTPQALALASAILGVALLLATARRSRTAYGLLFVAVCVAAGLAAADLLLSRAGDVELPRGGPIGVIDVAHANLIDRQALSPEGIDALAVAVARSGILPIVWDRPPTSRSLREGETWISVAATRRYSSKEVEGLHDAVERGAAIVIGTRWPYSAAVAPFLAPLGLAVSNVPLGTVRPEVDGLSDAPEFSSAWALRVDDAWTTLGRADLGDESFVVAVERVFGLGRVAVVADTRVFTTEALEGRGYAFVENLRFLERLLSGEAIP